MSMNYKILAKTKDILGSLEIYKKLSVEMYLKFKLYLKFEKQREI